MIKIILLEVIWRGLDAIKEDINELWNITIGLIQNEAEEKKDCKRNDRKLSEWWGKQQMI